MQSQAMCNCNNFVRYADSLYTLYIAILYIRIIGIAGQGGSALYLYQCTINLKVCDHMRTRRPNKKNEFLLDIVPDLSGKTYSIYDISSYFPHWEGYERKRYMDNVSHSIVGNTYTIHLIDSHNKLSDSMARKLARDWFNEDTTYHRLD